MKKIKKDANKFGGTNNIIYIDIIRIFACFMVIVNHTNSFILNNNFMNSTFYCIGFALCKIGVPLFLMITGVLLLNKTYDYKKVFKCIYRVLLPVIGLSFLFYIKNVGITNINLLLFVEKIISDPYVVPYWYIYALIGLYLTIPFLQKMIKNFKDKDYIIFIILFSLIPSFINTLIAYVDINISNNFMMSFFPPIVSIAVCGNYISKVKLSKKIFIGSIFTFVISYILMFASLYLPYLNSGMISYTLDLWNALPVLLMAISLFYVIRYLFENKFKNKKIVNIICTVASTTFGIYLIHIFLNGKLYNIGFIKTIFRFNSIIGIIILDFLVFIVCMIIIYILKKIPFIRKFL